MLYCFINIHVSWESCCTAAATATAKTTTTTTTSTTTTATATARTTTTWTATRNNDNRNPLTTAPVLFSCNLPGRWLSQSYDSDISLVHDKRYPDPLSQRIHRTIRCHRSPQPREKHQRWIRSCVYQSSQSVEPPDENKDLRNWHSIFLGSEDDVFFQAVLPPCSLLWLLHDFITFGSVVILPAKTEQISQADVCRLNRSPFTLNTQSSKSYYFQQISRGVARVNWLSKVIVLWQDHVEIRIIDNQYHHTISKNILHPTSLFPRA